MLFFSRKICLNFGYTDVTIKTKGHTMKITKKIAMNIALYDDATPTGGKAHCDEHLDEFMEEVQLPYGSALSTVNKGLIECGIEPVTEQQVAEALKKIKK